LLRLAGCCGHLERVVLQCKILLFACDNSLIVVQYALDDLPSALSAVRVAAPFLLAAQ
jgi:hypothetical protein